MHARLAHMRLARLAHVALITSFIFIACSSCKARRLDVRSDQLGRERSVSQQMLVYQGGSYPIEHGQEYILPEPLPGNPAPGFPPELAGERLVDREISILVMLIVDANGNVTEVRPEQEYAGYALSSYLREVVLACRSWRFTPLQVKSLKEVRGETTGEKPKTFVEVRNLPFSLRYEFTFSDRGIVKNRLDGIDQ